MSRIDSLIKNGYMYIRRCKGDGNCYYRAVYYVYLETIISRGIKPFRTFIDMIIHHKENQFSKIQMDCMADIIVSICEDIYKDLLLDGKRKAYQKLFQSVLLIPSFDMVLLIIT